MKSILLLLLVFSSLAACSQGAFKSIPKRTHSKYGVALTPQTITAFRFTGPMAGYMYPQNQVVTGLGYGWQKLHWVDSTGKWYADFSISGVIYAGGNVQPSIQEHNIMSVGISLGFLNQLLMLGPVYNFPKGSNSGSFGVVVNLAVPLNN